LANLLIFLHCDQLINWASQLIVQITLVAFCGWVKNVYYVFLSVQKLLQKWILKLFIVLHIILDCAYWDNFFVLNLKSDYLCYYHIMPDLLGIHCKVSPLQVTISYFHFEEIRHLLKGFLLGTVDRNSRKFWYFSSWKNIFYAIFIISFCNSFSMW